MVHGGCRKGSLTFSEEKCVFRVNTIDLLGYRISYNSIKPDPDYLVLLLNLPVPEEPKSLKRVIRMFSYYTKWINHFSDKIHVLNNVTKFPLSETQKNAFEDLNLELANAAMQPIDENIPFVVETDASDFVISAVLNQDGRPVAFHSHTLQVSEQHQAPIEKKAQAIVEAIHHWRHFLLGRHFTLMTDQKSVLYMYDYKSFSKIKNDKIMRWRVALAPYSYYMQFHPGKYNDGPDTCTRVKCASISSNSLHNIHTALCHPEVTRLNHFYQNKEFTLFIRQY